MSHHQFNDGTSVQWTTSYCTKLQQQLTTAPATSSSSPTPQLPLTRPTNDRTDIDMMIQREEDSVSLQDAQRCRWTSELHTMEFDKSRRLVALRMLINEASSDQKSKPTIAVTTGVQNPKSLQASRGNDYYRMLHEDVTLLLGVAADHRKHVQGEISAQHLFR
jgi:hypothetical protein